MGTFHIEFTAPWPAMRSVELDDPRLVGQSDRTWLIPLLHSTLANPSGGHAWPRYNKETGLTEACAYWEAAYYLFAVLLGWNDIGLGLKRLYERKRPAVSSPYLDLVEEIWNDHGQLDLFALWAWHRGVRVKSQSHDERTPETFRDRAWYAHFLKQHRGGGVTYRHDPFHGGSNSLHLGHCMGAFADAPRGELFVKSSAHEGAVLMLDAARGWCSALDQLHPPRVAEYSWSVDVVVRPLGWLGTFRRSRDTGRWFAGKHSVHTLGHA
jgi:hypothetical protein